MPAIEPGRVCVVKKGARAGEMVTIVEVVSDYTVKVKDTDGKEREMNIRHLEPTEKRISL